MDKGHHNQALLRMMNFEVPKALFKELWPDLRTKLLLLTCILTAVYVVKPNTGWQYALLAATIVSLFRFQETWQTIGESFVKAAVFMYIMYHAFQFGLGYGILGFVTLILSFVAFRLWQQWGAYVEAMETVEAMYFGDPLIENNESEVDSDE